MILCCAVLLIDLGVQVTGKYKGLEFIEPCSRLDPSLENCLARSANILTEHFRQGKENEHHCKHSFVLLFSIIMDFGRVGI